MYDNYGRPDHEKYLAGLYGSRARYIPDIVEAVSSWEHTQRMLGNYKGEVRRNWASRNLSQSLMPPLPASTGARLEG